MTDGSHPTALFSPVSHQRRSVKKPREDVPLFPPLIIYRITSPIALYATLTQTKQAKSDRGVFGRKQNILGTTSAAPAAPAPMVLLKKDTHN